MEELKAFNNGEDDDPVVHKDGEELVVEKEGEELVAEKDGEVPELVEKEG